MGKWIWLFFLQKTLVVRPNTYIIPNMILAVKNSGNNHHTSVVGVLDQFMGKKRAVNTKFNTNLTVQVVYFYMSPNFG